ncbi:RNA polymerase sigma factor [Salegentibacter agarivorans]|jgi:RNA polymerase sigma-70 factor (ECF subfamily)|tara:strand:- start:233 stop:799 length:567 start_codon:yes stop_codon:yes gene_type:complete
MKVSEGQYAALEVLFNKYYDPLCRFGLSYDQDIAIVEEKISDVFILLWNKRKELKKIKKPKSYIYVIAKNSLKKQIKIHRLNHGFDEDNSKYAPFSPSKEEEMIDQEQKEITTQLIQSILKSIPPKSRRIFELSRIDGLKYKEISEIVELSPRTIENHIALAMKYIHKGLNELNQQEKNTSTKTKNHT